MAADPESPSSAPFPATALTVLRRLRSGSAEQREEAFAVLVSAYWRPVYTYLRLRWRQEPADAEDLTQDFLVSAWEKGFFERFDPDRARFRTFLRTCLDRQVQNHLKAGRAAKRGGGLVPLALDFVSAEGEVRLLEPADPDSADDLFHREFVRSLFGSALGQLRAELEGRGRAIVYQVFDRYDLGPADGGSYAKLAEELGITVSQVTNYLHAARSRFRELVLQQLRELTGSEEEFREEAREVLGVDAT